MSNDQTSASPSPPGWTLYVDGASKISGAGAGVLLISPQQVTLEYGLRFKFPATNNMAEYEALIAGLRQTINCEVQNLIIYTDSQLIASQVEGEFNIYNPQLALYCDEVKLLLVSINKYEIIHILREQNARADALSKLATSTTGDTFKRKYIEEIHFPNLTIAARLRRQATNFTIVNGELYKRAFSGPYLKCLPPSESNYALREVHSGICGEHLGGRALAQKIQRQGFYWPTMKQDALELVQKCNSCQVHANLTHLPAIEISTLQSPWPFAQWGIDILGPFSIATGQRKFIILAVDYFTKWVEAEPLAKITETNAKQFLWKNIICRFGIPAKVITDNGTQFTGRVFTTFWKDLHIQLVHTAVAHPQTNGQIEVTN
ncbi:uncharacterized protein LOC110111927 [Dendrobium catenatum]|uniref:uncharacterized protein LOC110111927 n=1 Tax=Dendrobium catenatum TaxID=906689 RepID=UPI00109FA21B|nr:uncharacterized protein LOC110111927 [Dendrobium catenatum]